MSKPTVYDIAGGYRFIWAEPERIQIVINRFADDRRGLTTSAEIDVTSIDPNISGPLLQTRVTLTSSTSRADILKALTRVDDGMPWPDIIECLCREALVLHRAGQPVEMIGGQRPASPTIQYRLWPLAPDRMPSIIFGEAGTGKSLIALLAAYLIQTGGSLVGMRASLGRVLYLDYETDADIMHTRLTAIAEGLHGPLPDMAYRQCERPIAEDIDALQDIINDHDIDFIVADSAGLASGGDLNEAEMAIRMMGALRTLRRGCLLIDHPPKAEQNKPSPFGSVYKVNLARSIWLARQGSPIDDHTKRIALYHRKSSFGPLRRPLGIEIRFMGTDDSLSSLSFSPFNVLQSDDEELTRDATLADRTATALSSGARTVKDLAEDLGMDGKENLIRQAMVRQSSRFVKLGDGRWGLKVHRDAS